MGDILVMMSGTRAFDREMRERLFGPERIPVPMLLVFMEPDRETLFAPSDEEIAATYFFETITAARGLAFSARPSELEMAGWPSDVIDGGSSDTLVFGRETRFQAQDYYGPPPRTLAHQHGRMGKGAGRHIHRRGFRGK
jgi:hypothetical protein